jgi:hypothetical protein
MGPAIVLVAFDRPNSLKRILGSLAASRIPLGTPLVISIDRAHQEKADAVRAIAEDFTWGYGDKHVVAHPKRLGLREHILRCGDLSQKYGGVIVLEDDLYVSPEFYHYTLSALAAYQSDPRIAGISLYNYRFNETAQLGFRALEDGSDCYFMQMASSWGQCWTPQQWRAFRIWYDENCERAFEAGSVPGNVLEWPETSWKKFFIKYLIATNRYFVFPRISLTTNFSDPGAHEIAPGSYLQVPLLMAPANYRLTPLDSSIAVYDSHCELLPMKLKQLAPALASYEFEVDLYGCKDAGHIRTPYVLTARVTRSAVRRFGLAMKPHELNITQDIEGPQISLALAEGRTGAFSSTRSERVRFYFDMPGTATLRQRIVFQWRKRVSEQYLK